MEARAIAKYIRISPLKIHYICDEIRGKSVEEAKAILMFTPKRGAKELLKVLNSAVANAENNLNLDADDLYVKEAYANDGPTMKRFRPKAKGMAYPILKRSSHIGVVVAERE
ncbi:50S ribosomal protein L22 [Peptoniphilus sp.]|uniref:50S ribosomal protein L22 n=1 Tax=Peptoniphilus sp. TaxID=1971214 RepID=UPI003993913C